MSFNIIDEILNADELSAFGVRARSNAAASAPEAFSPRGGGKKGSLFSPGGGGKKGRGGKIRSKFNLSNLYRGLVYLIVFGGFLTATFFSTEGIKRPIDNLECGQQLACNKTIKNIKEVNNGIFYGVLGVSSSMAAFWFFDILNICTIGDFSILNLLLTGISIVVLLYLLSVGNNLNQNLTCDNSQDKLKCEKSTNAAKNYNKNAFAVVLGIIVGYFVYQFMPILLRGIGGSPLCISIMGIFIFAILYFILTIINLTSFGNAKKENITENDKKKIEELEKTEWNAKFWPLFWVFIGIIVLIILTALPYVGTVLRPALINSWRGFCRITTARR